MKEKILGIFVCMLMIGSIFGSMNTVKSEPPDNTGWTVIERGANFVRSQNITNPDIFSWESAHQWVYDGTSWVPYIFDETADYYQVQSGLIGTRIYKDGYAEFWDPDMTEVRLYEEMWILEYYDNDKWKVCDVYSPTFVVDSDDTSINITASFITDYPNSGERAFDVKYIFREGRPLKHEIIFTSHSTEEHLFRVKQKWAGIVSTKVMHDSGIDAVTELTTIDSSKFKFLKADGSLSVYENQWEMYYGYDKATHRYYILENHNLKPVEIDVHAQGLKADFVFGNWILSQDENLAIDPDTATLDNPTEDGFIIRNDEGYFRANEEYEILFGGYGGFGEWGEDFRGYVEWDVSSLAGVTLTANPVFKYEGLEDWATDEEINPITEEQPSDGGCTDAELYGYITSGIAYVEPFNFQVGENKSVDLGAYAKSDLQIAILSQLWFAIGFQSPDDEGELNDDLVSIIFAEEADDPYPIPPPTLYVEYTPEPTVTLGTAIYYFDDWHHREEWMYAENMVDGNEETYAIEWEHESVQFLCHNSGELVEELEGILKVEIRAKTYYNAYEEYGGTVILRPVFGEYEDGDNHDCLSPEGTGAWSEWFDITHDTNAPEEWMFVNIWVLQCDVEQSSQWNPQVDVFCSKVEIRVYYIVVLNTAPTQTGESPTDESIGINTTPPLHVICNDIDGEDTLTATWRSNSSGSWVTFATNTSISPGTNITQTNSNFSSYNTIYYWSINLTDGTDWANETYKFTIASTIDCGYIHLEGPPNDPNCYINTNDNYNIDVGNGGYVRIEVDYYMHCPGAADDGYVDISCQEVSDSEYTGTDKEGTLAITIWFDDDEEFAVKLHLRYEDWYGTVVVEEITLYSHCSTKEYDPPNSPPDRPDTPDGPTPIKVDEEHTYTSSATDPDGDQVYLKFDWGDGDDSGWLGPKTSGSGFSAKHSWSEQGYYDIRCIAKDDPYEEPSLWSYTLRISVPQPNP